VNVGVSYSADQLAANYDAVVLAGGSTVPRDLPIDGRDVHGVEYAMDFLRQSNKRNAGDTIPEGTDILATGRDVVVIGGGDTGSDCVGTSIRQGARSVTQIEIMPRPP
jgi:glutamate synthase (NADPH/NADH) small chain